MDCDNCGEVIKGRDFYILEDTSNCSIVYFCSTACLSEKADELLAEEFLSEDEKGYGPHV